MNPIPSTPTVAIARELRRLGLKQGAAGDFTVAGHYERGERRFTYVNVFSKEAERLLVEHADEIEERTANGPFPFRVSVRYVGDLPFIDIHNGPAKRVRELPASAAQAAEEQPAEDVEQAPEAPAATEATETTTPAADAPQAPAEAPAQGELWDGQPGPLPGPGVVAPGMHVEYLPGFRPGARTRHCHGGQIVSVGTTCVRWRPYKWHQDVRTPLDHMRIDPTMHVNQREWVRRMVAELDAGRPLPRHPEWTVWSLAQHLAHAAEQAAAAAALEEAPAEPAAPAGPVVLIPCGAAKQAQDAPAGELYTGSYHRACRRAADALTAQGGTVVVLSALYGLVPLDQVLAPYDLRMGQPGSVTPARLAEQARGLGLDQAADVTVLGGAAYTAAALTVWPEAATPLAGLGGMGYQLQALAAIAADQAPAAPAAPAGLPTHPECNLTLQDRVAFMVTTERAQGPNGTHLGGPHGPHCHRPHSGPVHRPRRRRPQLRGGHGHARGHDLRSGGRLEVGGRRDGRHRPRPGVGGARPRRLPAGRDPAPRAHGHLHSRGVV
jgi:hypothetical protein